MCYTWRHDYGLVKANRNGFIDEISSGMTEEERTFLWNQMAQLYDNVIAPNMTFKIYPVSPVPGVMPNPFQKQPDPNVCPKCGLKLEGVMGYVCSHPRCPTGLGGAWSSQNTVG